MAKEVRNITLKLRIYDDGDIGLGCIIEDFRTGEKSSPKGLETVGEVLDLFNDVFDDMMGGSPEDISILSRPFEEEEDEEDTKPKGQLS